MEEFAKRLRVAMEEKGVKAAELSRAIGIGKSGISQYLSGKYLAKQEAVYKMAKYLDVDPAWLMGYDVPMKAEEIYIEYECSHLNAEGLKRVAEYIELLKNDERYKR